MAVPEQVPRALPVFQRRKGKNTQRLQGNFTEELTAEWGSPVLCQDEERRWGGSAGPEEGPTASMWQPGWGSTRPVNCTQLSSSFSSFPSISEATGRAPKEKEKRATEGERIGWHHQFSGHSGRW